MPSKHATQHGRPSPVKAPRAFSFPSSHHLIVTTDEHVLAWDAQGLRSIFSSASGGILAAKEAKDGNGLLAIADSQVVLLHDINRGKERSYRLRSTDASTGLGQIRLLEYADDSKCLFFTTTLQNAVQSYSLHQSRLLDPAHTHPSPPTVLATPKPTHLLLTASESPPTIYLQNLTLRTPPLLLQPRASDSAVVVAAFHPERPNVFLLAFADGVLAAYDATRILRDGTRAPQKVEASRTSRAGEIGHFSRLHHVTAPHATVPNASDLQEQEEVDFADPARTRSRSVGITGAAFLPGHRSRAVSVGGDGKCWLVDFDCGGKILRTWHVRGPATSLSILQLPVPAESRKEHEVGKKRRQTTRTSDSTASDGGGSNIIAIGRMDGKVMLFDSVGLLLTEQTVHAESGRVIDLEWIKGPSLKAASKSERGKLASDTVVDILSSSGPPKNAMSSSKGKQPATNLEPLPLQGSVKHRAFCGQQKREEGCPTSTSNTRDSEPPSHNPDSGTVNHVIIEGPIHRGLPVVTTTNYMDLFSPVKHSPEKPAPQRSPQRHPARTRPRPRISSSTFIDNATSPPSSPANAVPSLSANKNPEPAPYMEKLRRPTGLRAEVAHPQDTKYEMSGALPADYARAAKASRLVSLDGDDIWLTSSEDESSVRRTTRRPSKPLGSGTRRHPSGVRRNRSLKMNPPSTLDDPLSSHHHSHFFSSEGLTGASGSTARPYVPEEMSVAPSASSRNSDIISTNSPDLCKHGTREGEESMDRVQRRVQSPHSCTEENVKLLPGRALSPRGPVTVDRYFPRRSSLKSSLALSRIYAEKPTRRGGIKKAKGKQKVEAEDTWEDEESNGVVVRHEDGVTRKGSWKGKGRADEGYTTVQNDNPPLNEKEFQEIERTWHNYCRYDQNEWGADEAIVFLDNNEALMKQCRFLSGKVKAQKKTIRWLPAAAKDRDVMQLSSENGSLKAQNELLKTQNKSMKEQIKSLQEKVRALERTVPESLPSQSERVEGVGSAPGAEENRDTGKPDAQSLKKRKLNNG
ncbi:hypothetical protein H2199_004007 [Coniosporium tulheliwenetii]|uniref:Uncharacterized protein n=1 Tax=Coniosporium tulheliwenetii TaxID=3383036 RepID=A0ACC2Z8Z3_9PEZI|nr:hypothetical protein H2199_004007 [Cladosporium sp. JES 115]